MKTLATFILSWALALLPMAQGPAIPGPGMPASAGGGAAAPTLISHNGTTGTSTTLPSVTAGNALVVFVSKTTTGVATPTDSPAGNTFVDSGNGQNGSSNSGFVKIFVCFSCLGSAGTDTITSTGAESVTVYQLNGASAVDVFAQCAQACSSGTSPNNMTTPALSTNFKDFVVAYSLTDNGTNAAGTNIAWVSPDGDNEGRAEYFRQTASGSITPTGTDSVTSDPYSMIGVAIHP
jgi:hypothetical protein